MHEESTTPKTDELTEEEVGAMSADDLEGIVIGIREGTRELTDRESKLLASELHARGRDLLQFAEELERRLEERVADQYDALLLERADRFMTHGQPEIDDD